MNAILAILNVLLKFHKRELNHQTVHYNPTTVNLPLLHENLRADVQKGNLISVQQTDSEQASAMTEGGKRLSECH